MFDTILRARVGAYVALALLTFSGAARCESVEPERLPDDLGRKIVRNQGMPTPTQITALNQQLEQLSNLASQEKTPSAVPGRMWKESKRYELNRLKKDIQAELTATKARFISLGLVDKAADWDKFSRQVDERFARLDKAVNASDGAGKDQRVQQEGASLRSELQQLYRRASSSEFNGGLPPVTFRQQEFLPPKAFTPSKNVPGHETSRRREASLWKGVQVASLDATWVLAAAPSTPAEAASCQYQASDLAATPDAPLTNDIRDLAAKLNYSPGRIYEYVYNNIKFEPYFGSLKGALATLQTSAGGPTDQASLMIALLRASNIPARYVFGTAAIADDTAASDGGRVARWVGAKTYAAASRILSMGGFFPGNVVDANNQVSGLKFSQVWVEACIPYGSYRGAAIDNTGERWVPFDPSVKEKSYQAGIAHGQTFNYSSYLTKRQNGPDSLPNEAYSQQVQAAIRGIDSNLTVQDVPYQGEITPIEFDILPTSLPYDVVNYLNWSGTSSPEIAQLPPSHRYRLFINGLNLSSSFTAYLPDIALNRITLAFKGASTSDQSLLDNWLGQSSGTAVPCNVNTVPVIRIDGVEQTLQFKAGTSIGICSTDNVLTMEVGLADKAAGATATDPNNVGRQNYVSYANIGAANLHALQAYALQGSDTLISTRSSTLLSNVATISNPNANAASLDATEGEFLHIVGLKYMRYITSANRKIGALNGDSAESGIHLGLTSSQMKIQYLFDLPYAVSRSGFYIDVAGGVWRDANLVTGALPTETPKLAAYMGSAYESYVWQENAKYDAVSTVRGLQFANEKGIPIYVANSSNWSTVRSQLTVQAGSSTADCSHTGLAYPRCFIDSTIQGLIGQGYSVTLPKTLLQYDDWLGATYIAENASTNIISMAINRYGGGWTIGTYLDTNSFFGDFSLGLGSNYIAPVETPRVFATLPPTSSFFDYTAPLTLPAANGVTPSTVLSGDPVNVVSGNLYHNETDIRIKGRGGLPIVFTRTYNSRNPVDGPLGFGWTHSFNAQLKFYGVEDGKVKLSWIDGTGAERFFATSSHSNGNITTGSVIPNPAGVFISFSRQPNGTFTIQEKNGLKYTFSSVAAPNSAPSASTTPTYARLQAIGDRNGNVLTLSYAATSTCSGGTLLCSVSDAVPGRSLSFSYSGSRITKIVDFGGRNYQYVYSDGAGNLNTFNGPLALAGKQPGVVYSYYSAADGQGLAHLLKDYKMPRGNGMRYEYYANGRVFRHTPIRLDGALALDQVNTFSYNDFRRETIQVTERGGEKHFFFDAYGNTIKSIDENGAERTYQYDCDTSQPLGSTNCKYPHNRLSETNPAGFKTQYTYFDNGDLSSVTPPRGAGAATTFYDYNGFGRPRRIKNGRGHWTIQRFDTAGNLTDVIRAKEGYSPAACQGECAIPPASSIVAWSINGYDSVGNLTSVKQVRDFASQITNNTATSNTGPIQSFGYDSNKLNPISSSRIGRKNADTVASTLNSVQLTYDAYGRIRKGIDADWYATQFEYDDLDRQVKASDKLGKLRDHRFDENGNHVGQSLYDGRSLVDSGAARFDDFDRLIESLDAGGFRTTYAYDATSNLLAVTNPDNYALSFDYDIGNQAIRAYDQQNNATAVERDTNGRVREVTDPNGNTVLKTYWDSSRDGRLKSETFPRITYNSPGTEFTSGRSTQYDYDANGNVTSVTEIPAAGSGQSNRVTTTIFDELNRPTRIVGPQYTDASRGAICPVTVNSYSALGDLIEVRAGYSPSPCSAAGNDVTTVQMSFVYDDFGRKIKSTDPLNRSWTYVYDSNNNVETVVDAKNQTTKYAWDVGHQLLSRTEQGGRKTVYNRDALGMLSSMNHPEVNYDYTYDSAHRLASVTDGRSSKRLNYDWSPGGLLNSVRDQDSRTTSFLYDHVGRPIQMTAPNGETFLFGFDPGGRLIQRATSDGQITFYGYNEDNSMWGVQNLKDFGATILSQHFYSFDGVGNRAIAMDAINGTSVESHYGYDELKRLVQVDNGNTAQIEKYGYDALDNRLTKSVGQTNPAVTAFKYDAGNQLVEVHSGSNSGPLLASYAYDANGNITSDGVRSYTWDALNQLSQVSSGNTVINYAYDGDGRRVKKVLGGSTTQWVYSGKNIYTEYASSWAAPVAVYTHGSDVDNPLLKAVTNGATGYGEANYYYADGLGSVVVQTSSANATVASQRFDAWGNKLNGTIPQSAQYGFAGREPDETGLVYMRARYYSPGIGRFVSRDPIGLQGGLNLYAYAGNNPINNVDPLGLQPQSPLYQFDINKYYGPEVQVASLSMALPEISLPSYEAVASAATRFVSPIADFLPALPPTVVTIPFLLFTPGNAGQQVNDQLYGPYADPKYSPIYNQSPSTLTPGPNAGDSIPARGPSRDFTPDERAQINDIGNSTGCHTCGASSPGTKTGNWVPDHQPPNALNPDGGPQRLYPHCLGCSRTQGGQVRGAGNSQ